MFNPFSYLIAKSLRAVLGGIGDSLIESAPPGEQPPATAAWHRLQRAGRVAGRGAEGRRRATRNKARQ